MNKLMCAISPSAKTGRWKTHARPTHFRTSNRWQRIRRDLCNQPMVIILIFILHCPCPYQLSAFICVGTRCDRRSVSRLAFRMDWDVKIAYWIPLHCKMCAAIWWARVNRALCTSHILLRLFFRNGFMGNRAILVHVPSKRFNFLQLN